ncbi:MAG: CoA transferase subunit A [Bacillota bacterium]
MAEFVNDGDCLYLGGFTHLIPYAAVHQLIVQGRKRLTLCKMTPDVAFEWLLASKTISKLIFSWAGNPGLGNLHLFRRWMEGGYGEPADWEEYTHFTLAARLYAGAAGLPFYPLSGIQNSDLRHWNQMYRTVEDPYTGKSHTVVPPLCPDVTILHAHRADTEGNIQAWGVTGEMLDAAFASKRVLVTVEEIIPPERTRSNPHLTVLPGFIVDAVSTVPYGAYPSYVQGRYDRDDQFYVNWSQCSRDFAWIESFVENKLKAFDSWNQLLSQLDRDFVNRLAVTGEALTEPVDFGQYRVRLVGGDT